MASPICTRENTVPDFLSGGGEMGKFIRSKDWSKTPLGSAETWPQSLRTTVSLCIASNFPISIAWGPHRVQIYNDGYWPLCGEKHPTSMGQDYKECWYSAWPALSEAFEQASLGNTRFLENQRMFLDRYGYLEETFFTFSFSPILDESGGVGGLFHPVTELTQQTLGERRLHILRALADQTIKARTPPEASAMILECLKDFELDLPFVLLYSISANGKQAILDGSAGLEAGSPLAPTNINLHEKQSGTWPFKQVFENGTMLQVHDLSGIFGPFHSGPYPESPNQALVFPVTLHGSEHNNYLLVAGISSRRRLDEKYLLFFELLTAAVNNALTKARAHDEDRKKAEALAEIDKAKTVFFSNISHEFRTPLTLMLGSLQQLLENNKGELDSLDKDAIQTSQRNALRLLRLVNNLLDFSRIEAGRVQARYQLTNLATYTADLASNFRSVVEKAGLIFNVVTNVIPDPVYVDKEMWEKIILNLLSNAFKYTLKGSISLSLVADNSQVLLKVKDTGVGIPKNELPKMFQRFHRVQNVVGRTYEGTGIGLSLVSELVKLHGGKIAVESNEAEGSVFTVSIPTGKSHLPADHVFEEETEFLSSVADAFIGEATTFIDQRFVTVNGSPSSERNANAAVVLVVDDNAEMRHYIKNLLQKQYQVITAKNGMEALGYLKEHSPQLILSDIMMPVMDGVQLLKAVRENVQTQNIPVILLSARAGEESKIEGYQTGADDYLEKPFSAKELLARVALQLKLVNLRQASEASVRNLFMQAPAAICRLQGPQHIFTLANERYKQIVGNREVVGKSVREALPELEGQGFFELLDNVYETGKPFFGMEVPVTLLKGDKKFNDLINFTYQATFDVNHCIDGILVFAVDVTEQVLNRIKTEESEQRFRSLADESPLFVFIVEPNDEATISYWNKTWLNYTGQTFSEAVGRSWNVFIHEEDVPGVMEIYVPALKNRKPYFIPAIRIRRHDGTYRWHMIKSNPRFLPNGEFIGFIGVGIDIHEQKLAEQALRESEEQFGTLANNIQNLAWIADGDGWIYWYNQRWYDYTGTTLEEMQGWGWQKVHHPDHIERVVNFMRHAWKQNQPIELTFPLRGFDGTYRWFLTRVHPIVNNKGAIVRWIGTNTDIEDQKTITEKLKRLVAERTKDLQRSNDDLQQFAHVASHDLKEPVRKIRTFAGRLVHEFGSDLPERAKTYVGKIESAAKRVYAMIDGVLMYASLDGQVELCEQVNLNEIITNIKEDLEIAISEKNAKIRYEHLPSVEGSSILIYQLFYNLINNSLKFSRNDVTPLIDITSDSVHLTDVRRYSLKDKENYLRILVTDNGIGFKLNEAEKIFKTFSRLHPKDEYEGTGLGLALCKKIAERHGGVISALGKENEGSSFEVVLPVKQTDKFNDGV